ncbi:unnamed protein product [Larinioides sclopetarius]|uniref:Glutathione synthetase n=1 Tax=Larinioides sclopetarius TaxID=280406 RepID=A0AAV2AW63_9ARAC
MERHILNTSYGLDDENLPSVSEAAKDYALFKGISMRTRDLGLDARVPVPVCLVPSPFPKDLFQHVGDMQPYLNYILHKIAYSKDILKECLSSTMEADEFTRNIFKIYEASENDQVVQFWFVLDRLGMKGFENKLPTNQSVFTLAQGIISAWDAYGNTSAVILFVVEDVTYNICDQRALEYAILEYECRLEVLRCSFKELRTCAKLKGKTLFVKGKEVSVVYYRTGYMPDQLEAEDWEVRLLMERSKAIKCPSAGLHLAGTKKVQVYLSKPGILEKFVKKEIADQLRKLFASQHSLEMGPDGDEAVQMGIKNPDKYVLKPEREGGGNNLYGEDLKNLLEKIQDSEKRKAYILMERINPPLIPNCIIRRDNKPEITNIICELGIFGTILGNNEDIYVNNLAGHLIRSKATDTAECGIAAGFGALDSPFLE